MSSQLSPARVVDLLATPDPRRVVMAHSLTHTHCIMDFFEGIPEQMSQRSLLFWYTISVSFESKALTDIHFVTIFLF